jgi:hypothetical protein
MYGGGRWAGPVEKTNISVSSSGPPIFLANAYLAIADDQLPNNFGNADGILGRA